MCLWQHLMSCVAVRSSGCVWPHYIHSNMFSSRHGVDLACVLICLCGVVSLVPFSLCNKLHSIIIRKHLLSNLWILEKCNLRNTIYSNELASPATDPLHQTLANCTVESTQCTMPIYKLLSTIMTSIQWICLRTAIVLGGAQHCSSIAPLLRRSFEGGNEIV